MMFWQWVQALGSAGASILVTIFRSFLRRRGKFSEGWNLLSAVAVGICMGVLADAVVIPTRLAIFGITAFFTIVVYIRYGEKRLSNSAELVEEVEGR